MGNVAFNCCQRSSKIIWTTFKQAYSAIMALTSAPQLLESIVTLSLSSPYDAGQGMKMRSIRFRGAPLIMKLANDTNLQVPFEPSSWGTGTGSRKTIAFNIPEQLFGAMAQLEDYCRQLLEDEHPAVQALWSSSIKPAGRYAATLRAKINTSDPRRAAFVDAANEPTEPPAAWKGLQINAVIHVRGVYIQKNTIGLSLEATHIRYAPPAPPPAPLDYFAS